MGRPIIVLLAAGVLQACGASADPAALVEERQADMREVDSALGEIRRQVEAPQVDFGFVRPAAERTNAIAGKLDHQFRTPGSDVASNTSPKRWTHPQQFASEVTKFAAVAGRLLSAARAGDREGFLVGAAALEASCLSCHEDFRVPKKK